MTTTKITEHPEEICNEWVEAKRRDPEWDLAASRHGSPLLRDEFAADAACVAFFGRHAKFDSDTNFFLLCQVKKRCQGRENGRAKKHEERMFQIVVKVLFEEVKQEIVDKLRCEIGDLYLTFEAQCRWCRGCVAVEFTRTGRTRTTQWRRSEKSAQRNRSRRKDKRPSPRRSRKKKGGQRKDSDPRVRQQQSARVLPGTRTSANHHLFVKIKRRAS